MLKRFAPRSDWRGNWHLSEPTDDDSAGAEGNIKKARRVCHTNAEQTRQVPGDDAVGILFASTHRRRSDSWRALLGTLAVFMPWASAHVGLPAYEGPDADQAKARPAFSEMQTFPPGQAVFTTISYGRPDSTTAALHCNGGSGAGTLDFAPPGDKRAEGPGVRMQARSNVPLAVNQADQHQQASHGTLSLPAGINNEATLQTGEVLTRVKAIETPLGMVLVSKDENFFNRLRTFRTSDELLLRTPRAVHPYRVTRAVITESELYEGTSDFEPKLLNAAFVHGAGVGAQGQGSPDSLTLAACHPFQPISRASRLYIVHAQRFSEETPSDRTDAPEAASEHLHF